MRSFLHNFFFVFLLLLFTTTLNKSICNPVGKDVLCNENDQNTLLIFKKGVMDSSNQLSSWTVEKDCCLWKGVCCNNITGRVTELSLSNHTLRGEINLRVLQLEFLNHLDLSYNHFKTVSMPPCQISKSPITPFNRSENFSIALHYLNFSSNYALSINDLHWLSQLSSLRYLDLSYIDIGNETKWLHYIAMLPSLSQLYLTNCGLADFPSIDYVNFTSLEVLDLSSNNIKSKLANPFFNITYHIYRLDLSGCNFKGQLPKALLNLQNLKHLDLSGNYLEGSIPDWLCQYEWLQYLDIGSNLFNGIIPSSLGNISSMLHLDLSYNQLSGNLPETLGQLHNLNYLHIGHNSFVGVLSEKIFSKFSNLASLDLSSTSFEFDIDTKWVPPFQLEHLDLANTSIGPKFPTWLYTQRSITHLNISASRISTIDADMFWSFVTGIYEVDISNNLISAEISNITLSANVSHFDVSHNSLFGSISSLLCQLESNRESKLDHLDLSYNHLSGALPDCWVNWKQLQYLNMRNNKLYGKVPPSIALLTNLRLLYLSDNGFFGNFSLDLSRWTNLEYLRLERNKFSGELPNTMQQNLLVFNVRANQFLGNIPTEMCNMSSLRVIDLADNKLSGSIPQCLYQIMRSYPLFIWSEETSLFAKGRELDYKDVTFLHGIDFSSNNLSGEIPIELFNVTQLCSLNLSRNHLTGKIPKEIGAATYLESLDLSYNRFYGKIPSTITTISFLDYLNLSYNNFTGQIPLGTQIQSFDPWSFVGNPQLCGDPLPVKCNKKEETHNSKLVEGNEENIFMKSLYLGAGIGFAAGFWGVCGSLFLIRAWRHKFFRLFDNLVYQLYVSVALKLKSFHQIFGTN